MRESATIERTDVLPRIGDLSKAYHPGTRPATDPASHGRANEALRVALVVGQLILILALVRAFELENRTVYNILSLAFGGFVIHAFLPSRFRLPFFATLSVISVPLVLGLKVGALVLGLGAFLIGVCHLPVSVRIRAALLVTLGLVLCALPQWLGNKVLPTVGWTVLGSMFMFRLALYFDAVRHKNFAHGWSETAAYLFMLPNVVFPLFPLVDYKTFVSTHFDSERFRIYDRGIRFIIRGVAHLLIYRWIYYEWALDERYINSLGQLVQHVVTVFLLYLKVSGLFHLIVGVLCLYGFRLPETHHLYFLSSSVTDFWRRINIYWKDFMMKLVYYPSFFRLRRYGNRLAMIVATLIVFAGTWLLHWYQTWWITGRSNLFSKRDMAFWGILGALVVLTMLWEMRPGRRVSKISRKWSMARAAGTVGTFVLICVVWSLWNLQSQESWLFMWTQARHSTPAEWYTLVALLVAAFALAGFGWGAPTLESPASTPEPLRATARKSSLRAVPMAFLLALAIPSVARQMPPRMSETVLHLKGHGDALVRAGDVQMGYYDDLTASGGEVLGQPWSEPAPLVRWAESSYHLPRSDFLIAAIAPSRDSLFRNKPLTTNVWGMRDRDYSLAKDSGTYRVAVMGASHVMGYGVANGESFESVLETRMDSLAQGVGRRVEILNFAVAAYSLPQSVYAIDRFALRFAPDLIVLTVGPFDLSVIARHVTQLENAGLSAPDSALAVLYAAAGVGRGVGLGELRPFEEAINIRVLQWATEIGERVGARVVVASFRLPGQPGLGNLPTTYRAARAVALPLVDCTSVFDGLRADEYRVSEDDGHFNAAGHRLAADCLFDGLATNASTLGLKWMPPALGGL